MFINGTQAGSTYTDSTNYLVNSSRISIAGDTGTGGSSYNGWIDEFRVSNIARYTTAFTPSTAPFVNDANTLLLLHMDGTDGSTSFEDDNGARAQRGITAIGGALVSTAQSQFGGASALFDGNGDYLNLTTDPAYTFAGDFTIECWYRLPGAVPSIAPFFFNDHLFYLTNDGGVAKYAIFSGGNNRLLTGSIGTVSSGVWYHVAFVRSGSTLAAYHNGVQQATSTWSNTMTTQANNYIGFYPSSSFFNGHIDEYRISNSARYTANFTPSTTPFVNDANTLLLLHMDSSPTPFNDDNGTIRVKRLATPRGAASISTTQSRFGGSSIIFDGSTAHIDVVPASDFNFGTGNFTVEAWIYVNNVNNIRAIWGNSSSGFYIQTNRSLNFFNSATGQVAGLSNAIPLNTWTHVAFTANGATAKIWIDGVERQSSAISGIRVQSRSD
jgi:hypothetical protein